MVIQEVIVVVRAGIRDVAQPYQTPLRNGIPINNFGFTNEMRIKEKLFEAFKRGYRQNY